MTFIYFHEGNFKIYEDEMQETITPKNMNKVDVLCKKRWMIKKCKYTLRSRTITKQSNNHLLLNKKIYTDNQGC